MKIVVTGGAGFIGSHVAEFYANQSADVVVFDNLSRYAILGKKGQNESLNWEFLKQFKNITRIKGDVRNFNEIKEATKGADVIVHTAGQTAVTTSVENPTEDFSINVQGTFSTLEAARVNDVQSFVFTSTNKVYGDNVNTVPLLEKDTRYAFGEGYEQGIPESFSIDLCKHTPYGTSKLAADLYVQDYSRMYGLKSGVFRMSCIYGTRQFGLEDQGWVAWFIIAHLLKKKITIYGNGKQVRDVLYVSDLVQAFDMFIRSKKKNLVLNMGGGPQKTLSLLELVKLLEDFSGEKVVTSTGDWRPSDQKVYISDIRKAKQELRWEPVVTPEQGIKKLYDWIFQNKELFHS